MENEHFVLKPRLGIYVPNLVKDWDDYNQELQHTILLHWEKIRGHIPDRIKELEGTINEKQAQLDVEEDFPLSCKLNSEISELASIINDLWLWYRTTQDTTEKSHF